MLEVEEKNINIFMKDFSQYILEKFKISKDIKNSVSLSDDALSLILIFYKKDKKGAKIIEKWILENDINSFIIYFPYNSQLQTFKDENKNIKFIESTLSNNNFREIESKIFKGNIGSDEHKYIIYDNRSQCTIYKGIFDTPSLMVETYTYWCIIYKKN